MSYSILSSGNQTKRQALGGFDLLASSERNRNQTNKAIEDQASASRDSAIGTTVGAAATQYALGSNATAAVAAPVAESMAMAGTVEALEAGSILASQTAGAAEAVGGVAAITGSTAATGAASTGGAGFLAAMGPVGWAAAAGLLAVSLFS